MTTPPEEREHNATHESSTSGESIDAIRTMARQLANVLGHIEQPQGRIQENRAIVALENFKKLAPPTFNEMSGPDTAESWLDQIERAFDVMNLSNDLKFKLGTYQLIDQVGIWWRNVSRRVDAPTTWEQLTKLFLERYFLPVHRSMKRDEFRSLIQGNMSVTEYEAKFESLSRFEKSIDNDLEEKVRLFLKRLKPSIREKVYHLNYSSIADAVRTAMKVEQERADTSRFLERKRGTGGKESFNHRKKHKSDSKSCDRSSDRSHSFGFGSENWGSRERIYFECGQPGHMRKDCPSLSQKSQSFQPSYCQTQTRCLSRSGGEGQSCFNCQGRGQSQNGSRGGGSSYSRGGGRTSG